MKLLHFACLALLFDLSAVLLHAVDASDSFTLNLPFAASAATPAWLGHPVTAPGPFATLDLPIMPPDATASLLITVFFQEENGGFMRISWQSAAGPALDDGQALPGPGEASLSSVLCDNFYEGIGMSNQRSLLVPADAMKQPGTLHFQTGSATLGITAIQMEWVENTVGLASPAINDVLVTAADGHTQLASNLSGLPANLQDPAWHGQVVTVPVTDVPLRIERGLDFSVQINGTPTLARIALQEAGLPWGQHLVVWVNGQRTGTLVPNTPSLDSIGYATNSTETYVGWREGTFLVPVNEIVTGQNTLQFSAEPDVPPTGPTDPGAPAVPLALKEVVLQLAYPAVSAAASDSAVTAAIPTGATVSVSTPPASSTRDASGSASAGTAPAPASAEIGTSNGISTNPNASSAGTNP